MKDHFSVSRRRKPKLLKLVCCFNGTFQPRPPSGKLRYAGGDTRIVSVDRTIGFSKLKSKVLELFSCPNGSRSFSLVYHLPDAKSVDGDTQLVLITCDDDVWCMIEKLESFGTHPRLWVFVCHDNAFGNVIDKCCVDLSRNLKACLSGGDNKVKKQGSGVRDSDDLLRKLALKQQLLAKQTAKVGDLPIPTDCRLEFKETKVECDHGKDNSNNCVVNLSSETEAPLSNERRNPSNVVNSYRMNTLDGDNCGSMGYCPVSHSHPFNPTDCNVRMKSDVPSHSLSHLGDGGQHVSGVLSQFGEAVQSLKWSSSCDLSMNTVSYINRENIVPRSLECNTVQTAFAPLYSSSHFVASVCPQKSLYSCFQSGIRNHRFGLGDTRNPGPCPYHVENLGNSLTEMGNRRSIRLDGRPSMGKLQCGLRSSLNIRKQGQGTKGYYPTSWKPSSISHLGEVKGEESTIDYSLIKQTCLFNGPRGSLKNLEEQGSPGFLLSENPNLKEHHLGMCFNVIETTASCKRNIEGQIDVFSSPIHKMHELLQQTVLEMPTNDRSYFDIKEEADLMNQHEAVNISGFPNNPGYGSGIGVKCVGKVLDREKAGSKSSTKCQDGAHTLQDGTASPLDVSLHNLSLSSFKEMDSPSPSLTAVRDVTEALLKPQSKLFDVMDEEHFSSGPQVEKSSEAASNSSSHKTEKDDDEKAETKQELQSNFSIDEKERLKCLKINGGVPADLAAFYTHLATRELQTINNSDLEYLKEIGSGTYGTVFYGKWKGSDVAIKKIKPCCFTEGSVEEDRLVADFWKEAHTLGQLHHPNIVALYGAVTDGPVSNLAAVTEYMVNGSLKQVLRRKDRTIDRRKRLIIAMDAAFGMEYLHGKNIVHFDLKSHNLLVNMKDPQRPVCKISDLGLSKIKQKTLVSGGVRGTIPWMAPELLNNESMVTEKVDVYSFGIVMWELLTGEEPYANMRSQEMIGGIIRGALRPEVPSWCDPAWRSLMERCCSSDPEARPAFSEIAKELRAMAAAMNIK